MVSKKKRLLGKVYAKSLDETAFILDTFKIPKMPTEKLIVDLHGVANLVRKQIGEPPQKYRTIRHKKVVKA